MKQPSSRTAGTLRLAVFSIEDQLESIVDRGGKPLVYCARAETNYSSRLTFDAFSPDGARIAQIKNSNIYPSNLLLHKVQIDELGTRLLERESNREVLWVNSEGFTAKLAGNFYLSNGTHIVLSYPEGEYVKLFSPLVAKGPELFPRRPPNSVESFGASGRSTREYGTVQTLNKRKPS